MAKDTGGSAFPDFKQNGMTLRDYFAAKFAQTLLDKWEPSDDVQLITHHAYRMADLMLAERKKP